MAKAKRKKAAKTVKRKAVKSKVVKRKSAKRKGAAPRFLILPPDVPHCDPAFCAKVRGQLNQYCHSAGLPPGAKVIMLDGDKFCYCTCS